MSFLNVKKFDFEIKTNVAKDYSIQERNEE